MILPILYTIKGKLWLGAWAVFTTIAVTEAFLGQLMIAVVVALIGATPPTIAIIVMSRKQSDERTAGNKEIMASVNGVSHELTKAKEAAARAEGIQQERVDERGRQGEAAIGLQSVIPTPVIVENTPDKPAHVKPVV